MDQSKYTQDNKPTIVRTNDWREGEFDRRDSILSEIHNRAARSVGQYAVVTHQCRVFPSFEEVFRSHLNEIWNARKVTTKRDSDHYSRQPGQETTLAEWYSREDASTLFYDILQLFAPRPVKGEKRGKSELVSERLVDFGKLQPKDLIGDLKEAADRAEIFWKAILYFREFEQSAGAWRALLGEPDIARGNDGAVHTHRLRSVKKGLTKNCAIPSTLQVDLNFYHLSNSITVIAEPSESLQSGGTSSDDVAAYLERSGLAQLRGGEVRAGNCALDYIDDGRVSGATARDELFRGELYLAGHYWVMPIQAVPNANSSGFWNSDTELSAEGIGLVRQFAASFLGTSVDPEHMITSYLLGGRIVYFSDLRAHGTQRAGYSLLLHFDCTKYELGHAIGCLTDIGRYRLIALRDFRRLVATLPALNWAMHRVNEIQREDVAAFSDEDSATSRDLEKQHDRLLAVLENLHNIGKAVGALNAFITGGITEHALAMEVHRVGVVDRLSQLKEKPIPGHQCLESVLPRFYASVSDAGVVGERYRVLRARIAEVVSLVRTDLQSRQLAAHTTHLHNIEEEQRSQTLLQNTLEILTLFAIAYYGGQMLASIPDLHLFLGHIPKVGDMNAAGPEITIPEKIQDKYATIKSRSFIFVGMALITAYLLLKLLERRIFHKHIEPWPFMVTFIVLAIAGCTSAAGFFYFIFPLL